MANQPPPQVWGFTSELVSIHFPLFYVDLQMGENSAADLNNNTNATALSKNDVKLLLPNPQKDYILASQVEVDKTAEWATWLAPDTLWASDELIYPLSPIVNPPNLPNSFDIKVLNFYRSDTPIGGDTIAHCMQRMNTPVELHTGKSTLSQYGDVTKYKTAPPSTIVKAPQVIYGTSSQNCLDQLFTISRPDWMPFTYAPSTYVFDQRGLQIANESFDVSALGPLSESVPANGPNAQYVSRGSEDIGYVGCWNYMPPTQVFAFNNTWEYLISPPAVTKHQMPFNAGGEFKIQFNSPGKNVGFGINVTTYASFYSVKFKYPVPKGIQTFPRKILKKNPTFMGLPGMLKPNFPPPPGAIWIDQKKASVVGTSKIFTVSIGGTGIVTIR